MTDPVRSLARWCSLAVLAEPGLVRSLRLDLAPELDASAEADLWWSPLVESRTTRGIVLEAAAAAEFRGELRSLHQSGDQRPGDAWALVQAHHRGITPAVALEEEIAWLWVSQPDPGPEIEKRLRTVLAAVINEGRSSLAPWAGRAIPRLPGIAREQPSAWYLEQEALAKLPHISAMGTRAPEQVDLAVLALMSGRMRRAVLGTLRAGDRLYLGAVGSSGTSIEVPATDPRVVEVIRAGGTPAAVQVPVGGLERIDVGWGPISIRTRFGGVYDLPVWDGLDRDRLESSVVNVFDGPTGPSRLGVVVGEGLVATTTTTADAPPQVQPLDGERRLASTVVRRQGDLSLLRVDQLGTRESLPVRRLRRPPEPRRRWYGWPKFAGLIHKPDFSDIGGSPIPILLQVRNPSGSLDETAVPGGPVVVDGEISGLVTSLVPSTDLSDDGDAGFGNWSDLWALLYPEAAQASARRWLAALADVVQSFCLDLHTGFRPLGDVQPVDVQVTDQQRDVLRGLAEYIVRYAVRQFLNAALLLSDPVLLTRAFSDLPTGDLVELTLADPRQPAGPLDPEAAEAVLTGSARQDDQDLTDRIKSLLVPDWQTARDRLADLDTPGFSRQQDLVNFLAALFQAYRRTFASITEQYGALSYSTYYSGAPEGLAILAPLRQFEVEQIGPDKDGQFRLEGRFAELTAVFEWAFTELIDAVAAFDPRSRQEDEDQAPPDQAEPAVCYLVAQLPDQVRAGSRFSLLLHTTYAPGDSVSTALRPLDTPIEGRDVTLIVSASGLASLSDPEQNLRVPAAGDSQPNRFEFRADSVGPQRINVRAFAGGTVLGDLQLQISVAPGAAGAASSSRGDDVGALEPEPVEVTLLVRRDVNGGYSFQLIGEALYPAEQTRQLAGDPVQAVAAVAGELREMAARSSRSGSPALVRDRFRNLGAQLWADAIPEAIRRQFWAEADRIRSFTILSDDDILPWELLYPVDGGNDNGFLVEQFPVLRRVYGRAPVTRLRLARAAYVVPPKRSAAALEEVRIVRSRLGAAARDLGIVDRLDALSGLFGKAPNILHFAGHTHVADRDRTAIALAGGTLRPTDLTRLRGLANASPLVFFNACRAEDETLEFIKIAGWASQFLATGAGAFLGPLWPVRPSSARTFADAFYRALVTEGATLGTATQRARRAIAGDDGDPAWLAYAVYGDPSATVHPDPSASTGTA
jgi:hypothetical protein